MGSLPEFPPPSGGRKLFEEQRSAFTHPECSRCIVSKDAVPLFL